MSFLRGSLNLLFLLALLVAFLGPPFYVMAWSMDLALNNWIMEWILWAIDKKVGKFSQEFFAGLRTCILVSWAYVIAYVIFRSIFVPFEEPYSTQGSASARDKASSPARSLTVEKRRRESIPKSVKMYVWKRDEGRCVECGSKERLEYDHIIPLSKGGSNTDRNLQILCQRCNRSKGASIS